MIANGHTMAHDGTSAAVRDRMAGLHAYMDMDLVGLAGMRKREQSHLDAAAQRLRAGRQMPLR